jgi:D-ribose pyranase
MKKNGVLNSRLAHVIASMGHTDKLVVCDSGLPIPFGKTIIDLALTRNIPKFLDTVKVILEELKIERIIIANEMEAKNRGTYNSLKKIISKVDIKKVPHEQFKEITRIESNIIFVRTGEATPYANVILVSGVTF